VQGWSNSYYSTDNGGQSSASDGSSTVSQPGFVTSQGSPFPAANFVVISTPYLGQWETDVSTGVAGGAQLVLAAPPVAPATNEQVPEPTDSPNIIQPNVAGEAGLAQSLATLQPGDPAGGSSTAYVPPSTSMWSYLPGILWDNVASGASAIGNSIVDQVTEKGKQAADFANDVLYLATFGNLGSSNQQLSKLSQMQMNGQVSTLDATLANVPVIGNAINAISGTDLMTGQPLNWKQRAADGVGAVLDLLTAEDGVGGTTVRHF
jgi:hypothetical protein